MSKLTLIAQGSYLFFAYNSRNCFGLDVDEVTGVRSLFSRVINMRFTHPDGISYVLTNDKKQLSSAFHLAKLTKEGSVYVCLVTFWSEDTGHPEVEIYTWTEAELKEYIEQMDSWLMKKKK